MPSVEKKLGLVRRHWPQLVLLMLGAFVVGTLQLERDTLDKMDFLYARHYSVSHDLKLVLRNYRNLGV